MGRAARGLTVGILVLAVAGLGLWGALALWFREPLGAALRAPAALAWGVASLAVAVLVARSGWRGRRGALAGGTYGFALVALFAWWATLVPTNDRPWDLDVARGATGSVAGTILTVHDVRDFDWTADGVAKPRWETRTYDLDTLTTVDLVADHFMGEAIAHMMVSFGFANGQYLTWSIELRRVKGQQFSAVAGFFKESELVYVASDERDALRVRATFRNEDLRIYRARVPPATARAFLLAYVKEANALAAHPRWYNTLTTNCTTVVFKLARLVEPGVPLDWRVLVSGYFPQYAYDHGVLDTALTYDELRDASRVSARAVAADGLPQPLYSRALRAGLPGMDWPAAAAVSPAR